VYEVGLKSPIPQYSYATAIGLFRSVIGLHPADRRELDWPSGSPRPASSESRNDDRITRTKEHPDVR
jgi:hypothetical protein